MLKASMHAAGRARGDLHAAGVAKVCSHTASWYAFGIRSVATHPAATHVPM